MVSAFYDSSVVHENNKGRRISQITYTFSNLLTSQLITCFHNFLLFQKQKTAHADYMCRSSVSIYFAI